MGEQCTSLWITDSSFSSLMFLSDSWTVFCAVVSKFQCSLVVSFGCQRNTTVVINLQQLSLGLWHSISQNTHVCCLSMNSWGGEIFHILKASSCVCVCCSPLCCLVNAFFIAACFTVMKTNMDYIKTCTSLVLSNVLVLRAVLQLAVWV